MATKMSEAETRKKLIDPMLKRVGWRINGRYVKEEVNPEYKVYAGYGDISKVRENDDLPTSLQDAIGDFERFTGGKVVAVSVGADREETIVL